MPLTSKNSRYHASKPYNFFKGNDRRQKMQKNKQIISFLIRPDEDIPTPIL
jgi:hypothetical protein